MGTKKLPGDPVERELAIAQLEELALAHDGEPWTAWKDAIVEWHLRTLAVARTETWIPGLAVCQDAVVEQALSRFYSHHVRTMINRLRHENIELRRKMLDAVECARFYASGATDTGERASTLLRTLRTALHIADGEAKAGLSH